MFKAARMVKVDLQIPQSSIAGTTCIIANLKALHLMNIRKTRIGELDLKSNEDNNLLCKYKELRGRVEKIFPALGIDPDDVSGLNPQEGIDPYKLIFELEQEVQQIEKEVLNLAGERVKVEEARNESQKLLARIEMLSPTRADVSRFCECRFLYTAVGLIPEDNLDRLEFSLSTMYHLLVPYNTINNRRLIIIFSSRKDKEKLEKVLKSAYFEKIEIPGHTSCFPNIQGLRNQIQELDKQKLSVQTQLEGLRQQVENRLQQRYRQILLSIALLEIGRAYDKVGHVYHISGWIPQTVFSTLEERVLEATDQKAKIATVSSNVMWQVGNLLKIPTCFQNPFLLRPFEKLVYEYGIPSYREIEPTFFFALSFLFMFGVMFGDVGHGLALVFLGWLAFKKSDGENVQDTGLIIMECGVMSTIFGFLYGSFFGFEHILPALWFNPMENIYYFMKVTVCFGMIIISLALILNIINSIKSSDYKTGILGEFGLMGLVFYWGGIGLVLFYVTTGKIMANGGYLFLILFLPLMAIFFKEPLSNLYSQLRFKEKHPIFPHNLGIYLMESLIEVGDTVIGFLSNTVSFVRVAAFALAHAGLFLAVFSLANSLRGFTGGMIWYWLVIVLGNIGIIMIEGLVVSIQIIRLEYYEFFSKFFKGGGELYTPLKIKS